MYKYLSKLSAFLIAVGLSPFYLLPTTAETRCLNYWVNPATGKEECLNLPVTKQPVVDAVKPVDTPAGFEFLTESEKGENLFIQVNNTRRIDGILQSFPTVVTKKLNGRTYDTRYHINCDQRLVYIYSGSYFIVNNSSPIVVSHPGTLGYMIWNRSCQNVLFPTSATNAKKFRIVPSRCGEYRVRIINRDDVEPRRLNPYRLVRGGNLSLLNSKIRGFNSVLSNRQTFKQKNQDYNLVKPQVESQFQNNYQTSRVYQWQSCQRDYRH